ncbi:uncharacterized protein V6R79_024103 [Siganus canaliculatus]
MSGDELRFRNVGISQDLITLVSVFVAEAGSGLIWTLDPGPWILDPGPWTLDPGSWTLDPGPWTLDPGPWILDPGPWTL